MRYYKPVQRDNVTYSCDMLRLLFKSEFRDRKDRFVHIPVDKMLDICAVNGYSIEQFTSNRISAYKHMIILRKKEQVITLGLEHNHMTDNVYNNFIEFNPNKVDMSAVKFIMRYLRKYIKFNKVRGRFFEIGRWDLAVDIPVERHYVKLLKEGRREYRYVLGHDGALTEYSGKRNSNGFTKVYDKTKESKLDYDLTRVEVTIEGNDVTFPSIYLKQFQYGISFDDLTKTDKVLVEMLKRLDDEEQIYWFKQLGKDKQKSLKPYVFSATDMFDFSISAVAEVTDIVTDISQGLIEEGGTFIDAFDKWIDKYYQQHLAIDVQSFAIWKKMSIEDAKELFSE